MSTPLPNFLDAGNQENAEVATTDKGESDERNIEMTPNAVYGIMQPYHHLDSS